MQIDHLLRLVESYLGSRTAVLRAMNDRAFNPTELTQLLGIKANMLQRRRHDPAQWRVGELRQLAVVLRLNADAIAGLQTLAEQMNTLAPPVRNRLLRGAGLDYPKFKHRLRDYDCWHYHDLERLALALRSWQDGHTLGGPPAQPVPR